MNKPQFIWIIGSDGSGKSTIAKGLSNYLGYNVHHFGPEKSYEEGKNSYFNFIKNTNQGVILDRFSEGEAIYAPIYRNYDGSNYFPELEKEIMNKFNPILILLQPPLQVVLDRIKVRGEDFVKPQDIEYCYDKITDIFNDSILPKIVIDTSRNTIENNINKIIKKII